MCDEGSGGSGLAFGERLQAISVGQVEQKKIHTAPACCHKLHKRSRRFSRYASLRYEEALICRFRQTYRATLQVLIEAAISLHATAVVPMLAHDSRAVEIVSDEPANWWWPQFALASSSWISGEFGSAVSSRSRRARTFAEGLPVWK